MFKGVAAVAVLTLVVGALLAARLSQGPLPLDLLNPYILEAVNTPGAAVRYSLGGTDLRWGGVDEPFDLRVRDVQVLDAHGALIAAIPDASVSIDAGPLLREGRLALDAVTLHGGVVHLRRELDGAVVFAMETAPEAVAPVERRAESPAQALRGAMRALGLGEEAAAEASIGGVDLPETVRISDARVVIDDRISGITWRLPHVDAAVTREPGRVRAEASVALAVAEGRQTLVDAVATLDGGGVIDAGLTLRDLRPADFATVAEAAAPLAGVDLPLSGTVTATLGLRGDAVALDLLGVSLDGGAGTIAAPAPVSHAWSLDGLEVRLSAADNLRQVALETLTLDLEGAPLVSLRAALDKQDAGIGLSLEARAEDVAVDAVAGLWPQAIEGKTRHWIDTRLAGGVVPSFTLRAGLAGESLEALDLVALDGFGRVEGTAVDYLPPMPVVEDASADMTMTADAFRLSITGGHVGDLTVSRGDVDFLQLNRHPQVADINLTIDGPLRSALRLVDNEPLGYVSRYGLGLDGVQGYASTRLAISFPMLDALTLDDVEVRADSTIRDAVLPDAAFDQPLTDGDLSLSVTKRGMTVEGEAEVAAVPATVKWTENFEDGAPFRSRYEAEATLTAADRIALDLDIVPLSPPFLTGPTGASVIVTQLPSGQSTLGATLDLTPAAMRLPGFEWQKAPGTSGRATLSALMGPGGSLREINRFTVIAGDDLSMAGGVSLLPEGGVARVTLEQASVGETAFTGGASFRPDGGIDVDISGHAFDAVPFLAAATQDGEGGSAPAAAGAPGGQDAETELPPMSLRAQFDVVWVTEDATLENAVVHLIRDDAGWQAADVSALAEGATPLRFQYRPAADGVGHAFTLDSGAAGVVLRAVNVMDTLRGGMLSVRGRVAPDETVRGLAEIRDFRLTDAPVLAKVLSVAALTGILESLTGDGLAFSRATAPFEVEDGVLRLTDARAHGPSLGLTAEGVVGLEAPEVVDLRGTIVPVYAVNSLLGNLPVIGDLITGGDEGGGLFAATYTVKGEIAAPSVSVNPLSVLAPGFLRKLFEAPAPQTVERPAEADADSTGD
ncbi:hypothetical protein C882_2903 [Caenispirillum salinarum AK4]|uniref:YhdP central domain-containing protein n=1 Tax=Caenispirillum salinarum AK4 TaxID=1238182 RepID=K9GJK0_9PROT|nr:hypothetical protein C882_2903 [Caenispirillum salinarum AK4]